MPARDLSPTIGIATMECPQVLHRSINTFLDLSCAAIRTALALLVRGVRLPFQTTFVTEFRVADVAVNIRHMTNQGVETL